MFLHSNTCFVGTNCHSYNLKTKSIDKNIHSGYPCWEPFLSASKLLFVFLCSGDLAVLIFPTLLVDFQRPN